MTDKEMKDNLTNCLKRLLAARESLAAVDPMFHVETECIVILLDNLIKKNARQIQLEYIREMLPEIEKAMTSSSDCAKIGVVDVTRSELEALHEEFTRFMNDDDVLLEWDAIPLQLTVADKRYLALQSVLSLLFLSNSY